MGLTSLFRIPATNRESVDGRTLPMLPSRMESCHRTVEVSCNQHTWACARNHRSILVLTLRTFPELCSHRCWSGTIQMGRAHHSRAHMRQHACLATVLYTSPVRTVEYWHAQRKAPDISTSISFLYFVEAPSMRMVCSQGPLTT